MLSALKLLSTHGYMIALDVSAHGVPICAQVQLELTCVSNLNT